jgi:ferredoxin
MCQFVMIWRAEMVSEGEHYSQELLNDLGRRRYIRDFLQKFGNAEGSKNEKGIQKGFRSPAWLRKLFYYFEERRYRRDHFGQVVPMEDLAQVLELASSIVRIPCICRKINKGRTDAEYCFGLGLDAEKMLDLKDTFLETFRRGPEDGPFDRLTKEEAQVASTLRKQGLIHTIWTFKTPFIGGICNCDRADCLAMLCHRYDFRAFFRAEYVAEVSVDACTGCRECHSLCQFGAIGFSVMDQKTFIDPLRCYGCGICRSACEMDAIHLTSRNDHPLASKLW